MNDTHKVFSVFDAAAQAYLTPFFMPTRGLAIRAFQQAVNDEGHQFHRHAADYTLFEIGLFDERSGQLLSRESYDRIGSGNELAEQPSLDMTNVEQMESKNEVA